jgi:hypothetical protein
MFLVCSQHLRRGCQVWIGRATLIVTLHSLQVLEVYNPGGVRDPLQNRVPSNLICQKAAKHTKKFNGPKQSNAQLLSSFDYIWRKNLCPLLPPIDQR